MVRSKKVIIKNTTIPGLKKPQMLYGDQHGVFLADKDDIVVMRKPLEKEFLAYLQETSLVPKAINFIHPRENENGLQFNSLFKSPYIKKGLRHLEGAHTLLTFYLTTHEMDFSEEVGVPLWGNPHPGIPYNDKGNFRKLLRDLNIPIPFGFEFVSREGLIDTLNHFLIKIS